MMEENNDSMKTDEIDSPLQKQVHEEEQKENHQSSPQPLETIPQPPIKRPVGRPRKHPLPTYPQQKQMLPQPLPPQPLKDLEDMFQVSSRDVQKFILKKKIKKYVAKYMEKLYPSQQIQHHPQSVETTQHSPQHPVQSPSGSEDKAYSEEANSALQDEFVDVKQPIAPSSKLAQILGMNKSAKTSLRRY